MADQQKPKRDRGELKQDALVEKLLPDPSQRAHLAALVGFLGKSARSGYWRLYVTARLDDYLEIPDDAIVHCDSLATPQNPLGGSRIWVPRSATFDRVQTVSRQTHAEFLQGDFVSNFLSRAGRMGAGGPAGIMAPISAVSVSVVVTVSMVLGVATISLGCMSVSPTREPSCSPGMSLNPGAC